MPAKYNADTLLFQIRAAKLVQPLLEYQFHPSRKWRADFAWPDHNLIVEFEGGVWTGGRHTRGGGFEGDCEKYNAATLMGYRVLRFTSKHVQSGEALNMIETALEQIVIY